MFIADNCEWYRGCSFSNRTVKGIFPVSHVEIKWSVECVSTSDVGDIANSKELTVVMEVSWFLLFDLIGPETQIFYRICVSF